MAWYFIGVDIINRTNITWSLEDTKFLLCSKKYFIRSLRSLVKYFSTLEEKFRIYRMDDEICFLK